MIWLEQKYIKLCNLPDLIEKNKNIFNFRCVLCGDSKLSKSKKRGYIILKNDKYIYYCHNCHRSLYFTSFLKEFESSLYQNYVKELMIEKYGVKENQEIDESEIIIKSSDKTKQFYKQFNKNDDILNKFTKVTDIKSKNAVIRFLQHRKLPDYLIKKIYWTDDFMQIVNDNISKKYNKPFKETRIIIPVYNINNELIALQSRSLKNDKYKYLIVNIKDELKLWNIENVDLSKDVYVFEAVFDACFIKNSVANLGSGFNLNILNIIKNPIFVLDNDWKYNKNIRKKIDRLIDNDCKVVIMPNRFKYKDINEAMMKGLTQNQIYDIIKENIYSGLRAKIELSL